MSVLFRLLLVLFVTKINSDPGDFRPPAVPLISFSPHMSVWSFSDNLTDTNTIHWNTAPLDFHGLIDIDNSDVYRFLGADPSNLPALIQKKVIVQPWRTIYKFSNPLNTVELVLTFSQPTSVDEPFTYITFDVRTLDDKNHTVRIYFEEGALAAVNNRSDKVYWSRTDGNITVLTMNAYNQIPFHVHGDGVRFNWGYAHLISENNGLVKGYQGYNDNLRQAFIHRRTMPDDDTQKPRYPDVQPPSSAFIIDFGQISNTSTSSSYLTFLYDDVYSIFYFQEWQQPYWRVQYNNNVTLLINKAVSDYQLNMKNITDSNEILMTLLNNTGGNQYALLGSLVTRQITAALTKTWSNRYNRSLLFLKEVGSGGAISTVDVIFPSAPFFLWLYPEMLRDILVPVLLYANNETTIHYNLPWAPHHLGNWPICDLLSKEQEQMPVEESANMLLMMAALVQRLNTTDFLQPYWNVMETWAQYLNSSLPDPGNQLCTDDFEGPSPHNCNLALKGILGMGAYAILLNATGQIQRAAIYMDQARLYVNYWLKAAQDDGHYRLQYDLPNTWSQKYNLIYQSILSLNLFPSDLAHIESKYYATKMLDYGIPLDSRSNLTKADWSSWTVAFSGDEQLENTVWDKFYRFANETPDRGPLSDCYDVSNGRVVHFHARPVLGALFIRALLKNLDKNMMNIQ